MIKRQIFLTLILLGGSLEISAIRGGGGGIRGGGRSVSFSPTTKSYASPGREGFSAGRKYGNAPRSFAQPSSRPSSFARPGGRAMSRPQNRPATLPGYAGSRFTGSRFAGRPVANRVGGKFDLSRPRRLDSHRTEQSISKQQNFMNRRVGRHNWQWLAANNFPLFISTFPFAYNAEYGDYPPVYYDYYDEYGSYPTQSGEYDMMMAEQGPADQGEPTQEDIMNCQADCSPQCMGDCRAQGELSDSECMGRCKQICVESCRPQ